MYTIKLNRVVLQTEVPRKWGGRNGETLKGKFVCTIYI